MKAIQVSYMPATGKKPARLKARVTTRLYLIEERDMNIEYQEQALRLAQRLIAELTWHSLEISGYGTLPNGDLAVTLKTKE